MMAFVLCQQLISRLLLIFWQDLQLKLEPLVSISIHQSTKHYDHNTNKYSCNAYFNTYLFRCCTFIVEFLLMLQAYIQDEKYLINVSSCYPWYAILLFAVVFLMFTGYTIFGRKTKTEDWHQSLEYVYIRYNNSCQFIDWK